MRFLQSIRSFFGIPDAKQPEPPAEKTYSVRIFYSKRMMSDLSDASLDRVFAFLIGSLKGNLMELNHATFWGSPSHIVGWRIEPALSEEELNQHPRVKELVHALLQVSELPASAFLKDES